MEIASKPWISAVANYCSRAERCMWQVKKHFANKLMLSDQEWLAVEAYLTKERYVDSQRFANAYTYEKMNFSKWGRHKIAFELKRMQIPDEMIEEALVQSSERCQEQDILGNLLQKKAASLKLDLSQAQRRAKLIRFAQGRGFPLDEIIRAVNYLAEVDDEED